MYDKNKIINAYMNAVLAYLVMIEGGVAMGCITSYVWVGGCAEVSVGGRVGV